MKYEENIAAIVCFIMLALQIDLLASERQKPGRKSLKQTFLFD
jgi:hypothetical protein